jgi:hypothetical protein
VTQATATVIGVLSVALVAAMSALAYVSLNGGSSLSDARKAQQSYQQEAILLRAFLANDDLREQQKAIDVIKKEYAAAHLVKYDTKTISIDSVVLKYNAGELIAVCSMQDEICADRKSLASQISSN